jgi:peptide/nickel transport system permease protein
VVYDRPVLGRRRSPRALAGASLIAVLCLVAALAPWLASPVALDLDHGVGTLGQPLPPSADHLLGTDPLGRDEWARIAAGAGTSLEIAGLATALALLIGAPIGLLAGARGGWVDAALMRVVDAFTAFPVLLLAIFLAALLRETQLAGTAAPAALALGLASWTTVARVVRGDAQVAARAEHVVAARALGAGRARVLAHHVLPQLAPTLGVLTSLTLSASLLAEAGLSYLGLGPPPSSPTWGRMLAEGQPYYRTAPWLIVAPGVAIVLAVAGFALLARGRARRAAERAW